MELPAVEGSAAAPGNSALPTCSSRNHQQNANGDSPHLELLLRRRVDDAQKGDREQQ